jgi:hypothetical protein
MTVFKRGAIVEPTSDCNTKGKRGVVIDCDTRSEKSLVLILSLRQQGWYKWKNLKLLQPSISAIVSRTEALSTYQI